VTEPERPDLPVDLQQLLGLQARPAQPEQIDLSRVQKVLIGVAVAGALLIACLGFAGSYAAVSALATEKHFGWFARWFPIGIDAGIAVLLSLDLVLTGLRMRYPLLRQFAWVLTAATICFNASTAWGDWLAVGMHAIIPMLFIVIIEAGRFAVGRIARISANQHIESPPLIRWILSPVPTYRIWRRMRLWQLVSYSAVIELERDALILRTRLRRRYGRDWRTLASERAHLALELSHLGVPVRDTLATPLADIDPDNQPGEASRTIPDSPGQSSADSARTAVSTSADTPDNSSPDKPADTTPDTNVVPMSAPRPSRRTSPPKSRTTTTGQGDETLSGHVRDRIANGITDTDTILLSARDKFGADTKRETVRRLVSRHLPDGEGESDTEDADRTGTDN
jgi:hypothetical protein